jgi:hypothetical protein
MTISLRAKCQYLLDMSLVEVLDKLCNLQMQDKMELSRHLSNGSRKVTALVSSIRDHNTQKENGITLYNAQRGRRDSKIIQTISKLKR